MTEVEEAKRRMVIAHEKLEENLRSFFFHMTEHRDRLDSLLQLEEWKEENLNSQELDDFIGEIHNTLYEIKAEAEDLEMDGDEIESCRIDLEDAEGYAAQTSKDES